MAQSQSAEDWIAALSGGGSVEQKKSASVILPRSSLRWRVYTVDGCEAEVLDDGSLDDSLLELAAQSRSWRGKTLRELRAIVPVRLKPLTKTEYDEYIHLRIVEMRQRKRLGGLDTRERGVEVRASSCTPTPLAASADGRGGGYAWVLEELRQERARGTRIVVESWYVRPLRAASSQETDVALSPLARVHDHVELPLVARPVVQSPDASRMRPRCIGDDEVSYVTPHRRSDAQDLFMRELRMQRERRRSCGSYPTVADDLAVSNETQCGKPPPPRGPDVVGRGETHSGPPPIEEFELDLCELETRRARLEVDALTADDDSGDCPRLVFDPGSRSGSPTIEEWRATPFDLSWASRAPMHDLGDVLNGDGRVENHPDWVTGIARMSRVPMHVAMDYQAFDSIIVRNGTRWLHRLSWLCGATIGDHRDVAVLRPRDYGAGGRLPFGD